MGNDCAGILSPLFALDRLAVPYVHAFASELDKFATKAILANKPPTVLYKDMRTRDVAQTPRVDLYCCGFPCIPFSRAGNEQGFEHETGDLFFHALRYIRARTPTVFVLENVRGLCTHDKGRTYRRIKEALGSVRGAYDIRHFLLDTQDYGLPQRRKRLYIVGRLRRACRAELRRPPTRAKRPSLMDVIRSTGGDRITRENSPTLYYLSPCKRDPNKFADLRKRYGVADLAQHPIAALLGKRRDFVCSGYDLLPTLQRRCDFYITSLGREITPREALAFQGFPMEFKIVCSNIQTYKQAGNAMSLNVLEALFAAIMKTTDLAARG